MVLLLGVVWIFVLIVMHLPCYIDLSQARVVLSELGINLSERQMKRAAETDAHGRRKLPFFIDPIDGRLKIEKGSLVRIYRELQIEAEGNATTLGERFGRHAGPHRD
jgi:hypothetical protein